MSGAPAADVIVVGAGPAGSVAALLLAREGVDVLLLDRAAFPRPKPCGDCLSAAATELLRRLGLLEQVRDAGATEIELWKIVAHDGTAAVGRFGGATALSLERRILDATLLSAARRAGARFRQAHVTSVIVRDDRVRGVQLRSGDVLEARLVVGADGLRSVVARRLDRIRRSPRLRKLSLTARVPTDEPVTHGEMHLIPGGCVGSAPAGHGLRNLTVVVTSSHAEDLAEQGAQAFFQERVAQANRLRVDPFPEPLELAASGPFDAPTRGTVAAGAALVGDAAGYYDPFTGQGIYQAMAGAERLARAVAPVFTGDDPGAGGTGPDLDRALCGYAREKARLTRPARRVQRGVEWVLSRRWLADPVIRRLSRAPAAMDRLIRVTGDLDRPSSLLSPPVLSSFLFPPTRRTW